jgi:hypothetical protein
VKQPVPTLRRYVLIIFALKAVAPTYFLVFATAFADGKHSAYANLRFLTVHGVWEHHENFHLLAMVVHASQLWLVMAALDASADAPGGGGGGVG